MFGDLTIRNRISIMVFLLLGLVVLMGAGSLRYVLGIGNELDDVSGRDVPLQDLISRIRNNHSMENALIAEAIVVYMDAARTGEVSAESEAEIAANSTLFEVEDNKIEGRLREAQQVIATGIENADRQTTRDRLTQMGATLQEIETTHNEYVTNARLLYAALNAGSIDRALALESGELHPREERLSEQLKTVGDTVAGFTRESVQQATDAEISAFRTVIILTLIALAIGIPGAVVLTRAIVVPLGAAVDVAQKIGAGERDVEIAEGRNDETGKLLASMKNMLESINAADKEVAEAQAETQKQLDLVQQANVAIQEQAVAINELSTPVIRMWDGILLLPMVGAIDTVRSQQMTERLLEAIVEGNAMVAILDVTGVPTIDTSVARHIMSIVDASKILGADVILTGFRPDAAQTLAQLGVDFSALQTAGSLQNGITLSFEKIGMRVG